MVSEVFDHKYKVLWKTLLVLFYENTSIEKQYNDYGVVVKVTENNLFSMMHGKVLWWMIIDM